MSDDAKAKHNLYKKLKYHSNLEIGRAKARKNERKRKLAKLGLTIETYEQLLVSQNGVCAICKEPNKSVRDWHVDHCHTTGRTRGLLCCNCNPMLGQAKDSTTILRNAIEYLDKYK